MRDVRDWLDSIGLGQYADSFEENAVDWTVLPHLDHEVLKDMGVHAAGHRVRIVKAAEALDVSTSKATTRARQAQLENSAPPTASSEAQRRQLTVMFCDLVGSTGLSLSMDAEDYRDLLSAYQAAATQVIVEHEGYVARYMGDGLLVYFGYPKAQENDPERCVRAGLSIIDAVRGLPRYQLAVRIGIATGPVIVGDIIGDGASEEAAALGDTPNLASRLQTAADPDSVLMSPTTWALLDKHIETHALEPTVFKGLSEPVVPYRAIRARSVSEIHEASHDTLALVGRDVEVQLLLDRWGKARNGAGQVVLVSAEPGVGKSRVLQELRSRLPERTKRMTFYCSPYYKGSALYPVIESIQRTLDARCARSHLQAYEELCVWIGELGLQETLAVPLIAPLLSLVTPECDDALSLGASQNNQTLGVLAAMVAAQVEVEPVLLIAEDLHWVDPTTLEFLDRVITANSEQALLVVLTFRPEFVPSWTSESHVTSLALNHLTPNESRELLLRMGRVSDLPESTLDAVIRRADGVPLYLEEIAHSVVDSGENVESIPITLRDALTARLDRLGPAKEVAQLAAVIGRQFSRALLRVLFDGTESQLDGSIDSLLRSGLVHRQRQLNAEGFHFKHALLRDAAYDSLLKRRGHLLHRRLLEHFEQASANAVQPPYELLAHHALAATEWSKAFDYGHRAGVRAASVGANFEAITQFDQAFDAATHLPENEALTRALIEIRCELRAPLHAVGRTERLEEELKIGLEDAERLQDVPHQTEPGHASRCEL